MTRDDNLAVGLYCYVADFVVIGADGCQHRACGTEAGIQFAATGMWRLGRQLALGHTRWASTVLITKSGGTGPRPSPGREEGVVPVAAPSTMLRMFPSPGGKGTRLSGRGAR